MPTGRLISLLFLGCFFLAPAARADEAVPQWVLDATPSTVSLHREGDGLTMRVTHFMLERVIHHMEGSFVPYRLDGGKVEVFKKAGNEVACYDVWKDRKKLTPSCEVTLSGLALPPTGARVEMREYRYVVPDGSGGFKPGGLIGIDKPVESELHASSLSPEQRRAIDALNADPRTHSTVHVGTVEYYDGVSVEITGSALGTIYEALTTPERQIHDNHLVTWHEKGQGSTVWQRHQHKTLDGQPNGEPLYYLKMDIDSHGCTGLPKQRH